MPNKKSRHLIENRLDLLLRLSKDAQKIYIASAYVSKNPLWENIKHLAENETVDIRLLSGLNHAISDPNIIGFQHPRLKVKVAYPPENGAIFHPKLYIFHMKRGKVEAFVGSANFTSRGLTRNEEILFHVTDQSSIKELNDYFEKIWSDDTKSHELLEEQLEEYTNIYKKNHEVSTSLCSEPKFTSEREIVQNLVENSDSSPFSRYCSLLLRVTNARYNWFHASRPENAIFKVIGAIQECHDLIAFRGFPYSVDDTHKISGTEGFYSCLGRQDRSRINTFLSRNSPQGKKIYSVLNDFALQKIPSTLKGKSDLVFNTLAALIEIKGIGISNASRLMALAQPGLVCSFNSASKDQLYSFAGCTKRGNSKYQEQDNYMEVLEWIWEQPWFNDKPVKLTGLEKLIWNNRVALIDILAYDHHSDKPMKLETEVKQFLTSTESK
ncbi:restriction endonuclease PLD domain-containing protein [Turicimonas muris]|uniref:restriction endonuclease PLD domain-containing protein n=1 Tax=Turicimonas muris TaxID=1796652 RepID=UPI0024951A50|nr:restriction endonuclease PLD domain-containing protein [Turicimonas muris]